jgi:hypothetical protein
MASTWTCAACEYDENEAAAPACDSCGEAAPSGAPAAAGSAAAPGQLIVCGLVLSLEPVPGKDKLRALTVDVGENDKGGERVGITSRDGTSPNVTLVRGEPFPARWGKAIPPSHRCWTGWNRLGIDRLCARSFSSQSNHSPIPGLAVHPILRHASGR